MKLTKIFPVTALALALGAPAGIGLATASPGAAATWPAGWVLPNHHLTPGAWGHSMAAICPHVSPALEKARPSEKVKLQVYAEYKITVHPAGKYEIDHLVPLELDGSNAKANLWPEPNNHPNGYLNSKDRLENKLHGLVCGHKVGLATAQHDIDSDWRTAYVKYVGKP